jgi:hypothetical protein
MTDNNAKLRMSVYEEHKLDCAGCCEPLDWHTFKIHVWRIAEGDWADAFLLAGRIASGETTLLKAAKEKYQAESRLT